MLWLVCTKCCKWNAFQRVLFLSVALSITQQPNSYHPAFNDTNFVITESSGGIYTKDNFKFIADVKSRYSVIVPVGELLYSYPNSTS